MSEVVIKDNSVVSVHYRGTLTKNGDEFDNSKGRGPLTFMMGSKQMIPGFEAALMGKNSGDKFTFNLSPEQAYGERNPKAVQSVPLSQVPEGIEVGDRLTLQTPEGQVIPLLVSDKDEESVTLDMNHELAGEHLTFDVEIIDVRDANDEEVSRGIMGQISMPENDCCQIGSCK